MPKTIYSIPGMAAGKVRALLPRVPRLSNKREVEALPDTPEAPVIEPVAKEPGEVDFEQRYMSWGRGSRAEFAVYDYLTTYRKLSDGADFRYLPGAQNGESSKFILLGRILRVRPEGVANLSIDALTKLQYEGQGFLVTDFEAYELQPGLAQANIAKALRF